MDLKNLLMQKKKKETEMAKKVVEDVDDLVLCAIIDDYEKQVQQNKEMSFVNNAHANVLPSTKEVGMMCTINGQSFYMFTKHATIGNLGDSSCITNDKIGMYVVTNLDKSVQGSLGSMSAT